MKRNFWNIHTHISHTIWFFFSKFSNRVRFWLCVEIPHTRKKNGMPQEQTIISIICLILTRTRDNSIRLLFPWFRSFYSCVCVETTKLWNALCNTAHMRHPNRCLFKFVPMYFLYHYLQSIILTGIIKININKWIIIIWCVFVRRVRNAFALHATTPNRRNIIVLLAPAAHRSSFNYFNRFDYYSNARNMPSHFTHIVQLSGFPSYVAPFVFEWRLCVQTMSVWNME